jgi:hypothetical protein
MLCFNSPRRKGSSNAFAFIAKSISMLLLIVTKATLSSQLWSIVSAASEEKLARLTTTVNGVDRLGPVDWCRSSNQTSYAPWSC